MGHRRGVPVAAQGRVRPPSCVPPALLTMLSYGLAVPALVSPLRLLRMDRRGGKQRLNLFCRRLQVGGVSEQHDVRRYAGTGGYATSFAWARYRVCIAKHEKERAWRRTPTNGAKRQRAVTP